MLHWAEIRVLVGPCSLQRLQGSVLPHPLQLLVAASLQSVPHGLLCSVCGICGLSPLRPWGRHLELPGSSRVLSPVKVLNFSRLQRPEFLIR